MLNRSQRIMMSAWLVLAATGAALADPGNPDLLPVRPDPPGMVQGPVPFGIGEEMVFHVSFGFIPAGKVRMTVLDTTRIQGQLAYELLSAARSAKGFDWIFKVRDSIQTWIDVDSVYSLRFYKRLHEGKYRDEKLVEYNFADSLAYWWDDGEERQPKKVEPYVQDVFSAGFKTRTLNLAVGDTFAIRTHDVKKTYDLHVIVHKRETVQTKAGSFDCFKAEPVLKSGGLFKKERKARLHVWVTADERRIPVMMKSRASFGTVTVQIESYTPPRWSFVPEPPTHGETDLRTDSTGIVIEP